MREAIVRAAAALFAEQGYGRTTIAEVARGAGVSTETVYATFRNSTRTMRRITPLLLAVEAAAGADPAAAQMLAEIGRQRLTGLGVLAREAAATGQLAVSERECRDVVWAFTDGMLWHRLVEERGWSDQRYATWLGEMWVQMLVKR